MTEFLLLHKFHLFIITITAGKNKSLKKTFFLTYPVRKASTNSFLIVKEQHCLVLSSRDSVENNVRYRQHHYFGKNLKLTFMITDI